MSTRRGPEHGVDDRDDVGVVPLGGEGQPLLVPERAAEHPGPGHQVGHDLGVVVHAHPDAALGVGALGPGRLLVLALLLERHRADADVRAALQQRTAEPLVGLHQHDVVRVAEREVPSRGAGDAGVARRADAEVRLGDQPDPPVGVGVPAGDLRRPVGGPVVDEHDLELRVGLREEAGQAGVEGAGGVVEGHDHAQPRQHRAPASQHHPFHELGRTGAFQAPDRQLHQRQSPSGGRSGAPGRPVVPVSAWVVETL